MPRNSVKVHIARYAQKLPLHWLRPLEAKFLHKHAGARASLVFILALPRSGSTVLYQTVIHGLQTAYLSNLWNLFYRVPFFGGVLSQRVCGLHKSDFQSTYGFVEGMCGPAEGLAFWSHWTGSGLDDLPAQRKAYTDLSNRIDYFREVVNSLTTPAKPMVSGYLGHTLIVQKLRDWFPEAIFIRLHRDLLSNAKSIFEIRKKSDLSWFSVLPVECGNVIGHGVHQEVAAQVYWLNKRLSWLDHDVRTVHVSYEALCANPSKAMEEIVRFCNLRGFDVPCVQSLPEKFPYRTSQPNDDEDSAILKREIELLNKRHGYFSSPSGLYSRDGDN